MTHYSREAIALTLLLVAIALARAAAAPEYSDWTVPVNLGPVILVSTVLAAVQTPAAGDALATAQGLFNRGEYRQAIATLSRALAIDVH